MIVTDLSESYTERQQQRYQNSSIQLLLYSLPPMYYELEIFNYCIDLKKNLRKHIMRI